MSCIKGGLIGIESYRMGSLIIRFPNNLKHQVELMPEAQSVSLNQFAHYAFTKEAVQSETQSLASKLD